MNRKVHNVQRRVDKMKLPFISTGLKQRALAATGVAAVLLLSPLSSHEASAFQATTAGAQIYTEVGCSAYGRMLSRGSTVMPERGYTAQYVQLRIWTYSYLDGSWGPSAWVQGLATPLNGVFYASNVNLKALGLPLSRWEVWTEARWWRGTSWTNSVMDSKPRYTQSGPGFWGQDTSTCFA